MILGTSVQIRLKAASMHDIVTLGEVLLRLAIPSPARFETAGTSICRSAAPKPTWRPPVRGSA